MHGLRYTFSIRAGVRSVMNTSPVFLVLVLVGSFVGAEAPNGKSTTHSLEELSFLIGDWTCQTTVPGKGKVQMTAHYEWMYNGKVLKETLTSPGYDGTFLTT